MPNQTIDEPRAAVPLPEPPLMSPRSTAAGPWHAPAWLMKSEFARFLLVGGTAALAQLASAWCYRVLFEGTPGYFEISVALGYSVGTVISFVLNKFVTFRARGGSTRVQLLRFALLAVVALGLNMLLADLIRGLLVWATGVKTQFVETAAHVLTVGIMTFFNFAAMKFFAFARPGATTRGRS